MKCLLEFYSESTGHEYGKSGGGEGDGGGGGRGGRGNKVAGVGTVGVGARMGVD